MSVYLQQSDFGKVFEELDTPKYIVNNIDGTLIEEREELERLLTTSYGGEGISLLPSCACGAVESSLYIGETCDSCGTQVQPKIGDKLSFLVWVQQPRGVAKFIIPDILHTILQRYRITSPSTELIRYIMQANLKPSDRNMRNIGTLRKLDFMLRQRGIARGYNSFYENFVEIIELLEDNFKSTKLNKKDKAEFLEWIRDNKDSFFTSYLPIPNKSLFVVESNHTGDYIDREIIHLLNGVNRMVGIDLGNMSVINKQNKTAAFLCDLIKYYEELLDSKIFGKPAIIRKQITRTKSHHTIRAVVVSRHQVHNLEHIRLPWTAACAVFKEHIFKGLFDLGLSPRDAFSYYYNHLTTYSEVIDGIFKRLIREAGGAFPCLVNRNPALHRGNILFMGIDGVKTDPMDNTIEISFLVAPLFNMDFDGDMMHVTLLLTAKQIKHAENFRVHHNLLNLETINGFSSALKFPKSVIGTMSNFMAGN